ncbi:MAG TPA: hypothetical protein VFT37_13615 [Telluria sp.]|nr:hypothetical protein [Telluria sp.]
MRKFLLFGGFGLLPVWVIGAMTLHAMNDTRPESALVLYYWILVPMLTPLTLGIAAGTMLAYKLTTGSERRKYLMGTLTFVVLVGAVCTAFGVRHFQSKLAHEKASLERELVQEYVQQHPDVVKAAGPAPHVAQIDEDSRGTKYFIILSGKRKLSTVVDVDRTSGQPRFRMSCLSEVRPQIDLTDTCRK